MSCSCCVLYSEACISALMLYCTALYCQVLLLEESWCELFLLCSVQWCLPLSSSPSLFSTGELPELSPALTNSLNHLNTLLHRFRHGSQPK